jgi:hypothetical protein
MRYLLRILAVFVVCFVGIGFCLGWFSLSRSQAEPNSDKVNVNLSVDRVKMKTDIKKAEDRVEKRIEQFENRKKAEKTALPENKMELLHK